MRQSILAIVIALLVGAFLAGCTGQRSASDQSMTSAMKSTGNPTAGQGVEDPRG